MKRDRLKKNDLVFFQGETVHFGDQAGGAVAQLPEHAVLALDGLIGLDAFEARLQKWPGGR